MALSLKDAVLKSLEDLNKKSNHIEVSNHIQDNQYYDFGRALTPASTVSAQLGNFIRDGDVRIKRIRQGRSFYCYLTKNEQSIEIEIELSNEAEEQSQDVAPITTNIRENNRTSIEQSSREQTYHERDLHKLLSTYLKQQGVYSKTIFHEQSNGKDSNQTWTHPDMIGIRFLDLNNEASQKFMKSINRGDTLKLSSYELKKEISTDSDLKKAFFQAVSNSSWANYGYLVAFEFGDYLTEEMERLNQSFGIGVIELNANPYRSKVLFPAKYHDLDFKTIDKLCRMNKDFEELIKQTDNLLTAETRFFNAVKSELNNFCDASFENDIEIEEYCRIKNIPIELTLDIESTMLS
ncbi:MAG: hypothetical protein QX191_02615 [Methylococcaceae bacterium]